MQWKELKANQNEKHGNYKIAVSHHKGGSCQELELVTLPFLIEVFEKDRFWIVGSWEMLKLRCKKRDSV